MICAQKTLPIIAERWVTIYLNDGQQSEENAMPIFREVA